MNSTIEKKIYTSPEINQVALDNEISLILVSGDPGDPNASLGVLTPEYLNNDPFKSSMG